MQTLTVDLDYLLNGMGCEITVATSGVKDQQPSAFQFASARILICWYGVQRIGKGTGLRFKHWQKFMIN